MEYLNEYLTLEISPTERVAAYPEQDYFPFEDFVGDELGIYTLHKDRSLRDIEQGEHGDSLRELQDRVTRDQEQSAIGKYLSLHGLHYRFVTLRGYSQSEWAEVVIYSEYESGLSLDETLGSWFRGDVFCLVHEKLTTFTSETSDRVIESWEAIDSIGAVILDTLEDTKSFARTDFGIELTEEDNA